MQCPKHIKEKKERKKPKGKSDERKRIESIDQLDSIICLLNAEFTCMMCGGQASQLHHFFSKKSHANIRFEPNNHCPLCFGCHMFRVHSAGDTEGLRDKLIDKIGFDAFEQMKYKSKDLAERGLPFLRCVADTKEATLCQAVEKSEMNYMLSHAAQMRVLKVQKKFSKELYGQSETLKALPEIKKFNRLPYKVRLV